VTERVVFEALAPDVQVPSRSTEQSAGYDVRAYLARGSVKIYRGARSEITSEPPEAGPEGPRVVLQPGDRALVPTGFRARLPEGFEAQIRMRSSLAWKRGLIVPNSPGTVDADYPDEWFVLVLNAALKPVTIEHGERIAQIVLNRYEVAEWVPGAVEVSTDRVGGLGSTGRT
jgi:dUTP pyrophosphatase